MATIAESLAIAVQQHQAGKLQAAEQIYHDILAIDQKHAHTLYLLGLTALQSGNFAMAADHIGHAIRLKKNVPQYHNHLGESYRLLKKLPEAIASFRRALELQPDNAETHCNLGNALGDQGDIDQAVACYRKAINLQPNYAAAHCNLGNLLRDQGKLDLAVAYYQKALKLNAALAEAHLNLSVALRDQGKLDDAIASCRRAMQLKPNLTEAHNNMGTFFRDLGRLEEALACYRRAIELNPHNYDAHNNMGVAYKDQRKLDEAVACYRRALELNPNYAKVHSNLGNVLNEQGHLEEALICCRRALELQPNRPESHCNLGIVLKDKGDFQAAENAFRAALEHNPRLSLAHYNLAVLLGGKLPDNDRATQCRLAAEAELADEQCMPLHFGLGHVLDARGEYIEASSHFDRANALQLSEWRKRGLGYDPIEHAALVRQLTEVCTADFLSEIRSFALDTELPVFIVGLPRSGTTLTEQILASHSQVFGAGEIKLAEDAWTELGGDAVTFINGLRRLNGQTAQRLGSQHLQKLRNLHPRALRIVDKMPENYLFLGLLASQFPRAKVIHCRRDLRDVALSCWTTYFRDLRWANDVEHIAGRFHAYQRIMEHWRNVLPTPWLDIDYEETVADMEGAARKLVAWCGLEWEPSCLDFHQTNRPVHTASAVQVRQPVYKTSVGRWRHYEQSLASLLSSLAGEQ